MNRNDERFESMLRSVLSDEARFGAPASLEVRVAELDARQVARLRGRIGVPGLRTMPALGPIVALVALVAVVAAAGAGLVRLGSSAGGPGAGSEDGSPVSWSTPYVMLAADDFRIDAGEKRFSGVAPVDVHSDPGGSTYRTLEMTWREEGAEMRLYLYFAADDRDWWVSEIRTYDGHEPGGWIYYDGPLFRTPIGESFTGDVDLVSSGSENSVTGRLRMRGLTLTSFVVAGESSPGPALQDVPASKGAPAGGALPANESGSISAPSVTAPNATPAAAATALPAKP